jgi:hypothetical protein
MAIAMSIHFLALALLTLVIFLKRVSCLIFYFPTIKNDSTIVSEILENFSLLTYPHRDFQFLAKILFQGSVN